MNSGTIIYSGTYNVSLSGANKTIHVECSYFYDSGKVMTKPQTMQIQHPSVNNFFQQPGFKPRCINVLLINQLIGTDS
jgi:hypothetical protein